MDSAYLGIVLFLFNSALDSDSGRSRSKREDKRRLALIDRLLIARGQFIVGQNYIRLSCNNH